MLTNVLYVGDAYKLFSRLPDESISLIFTDPPYPRQYALPCFDILSLHSKRVLQHGGSLMTIVPHYLEPEFYNVFSTSGLKYRWAMTMNQTTGQHPRMAMGIEVMHKPIKWFVKGSYPNGRGFIRDSVDITQAKHKLHRWEQDTSWAEYYVSRLANGGVVLDPFFGTGTLAVVCHELGIPWIGFEIDPEVVERFLQKNIPHVLVVGDEKTRNR